MKDGDATTISGREASNATGGSELAEPRQFDFGF